MASVKYHSLTLIFWFLWKLLMFWKYNYTDMKFNGWVTRIAQWVTILTWHRKLGVQLQLQCALWWCLIIIIINCKSVEEEQLKTVSMATNPYDILYAWQWTEKHGERSLIWATYHSTTWPQPTADQSYELNVRYVRTYCQLFFTIGKKHFKQANERKFILWILYRLFSCDTSKCA